MGNSCPCRRCEKIPRKPVTLYMGGATPIESLAHHNYSIGSQPPPKTFLHYFVQPPTRGSGLGILQVPRFRLPVGQASLPVCLTILVTKPAEGSGLQGTGEFQTCACAISNP